MLTGGYAPCLPSGPINRIKLQGRIDGYETDDVIVFVEDPVRKVRRKLLAQVKHTIHITEGDKRFREVIQSAWNDFNNTTLFDRNRDILALITGPLTATDTNDVIWLLDQARLTLDANEFLTHVNQLNFSSANKRRKLDVFRHHLKQANQGKEISSECLHLFLKCFHLLGCDLGKEVGVVLSLLQSHISQHSVRPLDTWHKIVGLVQTRNQGAGTITPDNIPEEIREDFKPTSVEVFPRELSVRQEPTNLQDWNASQFASELAIVSLVGAWNERNAADLKVIDRIASS